MAKEVDLFGEATAIEMIAQSHRYDVTTDGHVVVISRKGWILLTVVLTPEKILFTSLGGFREFNREHEEFSMVIATQLANALDGLAGFLEERVR